MEFFSLIVQALVALAAAYTGARWALANTKRERVFDRRLDWYQRTLGALEQLQFRVRQQEGATRTQDAQWLSQAMPEVIKVTEAFRICLAEAELFASKQARQQLEELSNQLDQEMSPEREDIASLHTGPSLWRLLPAERERETAIIEARLRVYQHLLGRARNELAADGRAWLDKEEQGLQEWMATFIRRRG